MRQSKNGISKSFVRSKRVIMLVDDYSISPETLISQAIELIDHQGKRTLFVIGENHRFLGTLTDGDVRRGILKGVRLSDTVAEVMNVDPITLGEGQDVQGVIDLADQRHVWTIPVLNKERQIVDLLQHSPRDEELSQHRVAVIMVGGLGSRLKERTENCPKPLLPIGERPILDTIVERLAQFGFTKIYLSVNYKAEMIKEHFGDGERYGVSIFYIEEKERLGTAGALSLLPESFDHPILVMNGDVLTQVNLESFFDFHYENSPVASMAVKEYDFQVPYGVVNISENLIESLDEKPVKRFFVNAGIYILGPNALKHLQKGERCDMTTLFNRLIERDEKVVSFPIREYWLDIGQEKDYQKANTDFDKFF